MQKWYVSYADRMKKKYVREITMLITARKQKTCSFVEWRDQKLVYRRYASLFFVCSISPTDNELLTLELIHRYVEMLDTYFGSVCELDVIFNFEKAYFILDELFLDGEMQESSRRLVMNAMNSGDTLQEVSSTLILAIPVGKRGRNTK